MANSLRVFQRYFEAATLTKYKLPKGALTTMKSILVKIKRNYVSEELEVETQRLK